MNAINPNYGYYQNIGSYTQPSYQNDYPEMSLWNQPSSRCGHGHHNQNNYGNNNIMQMFMQMMKMLMSFLKRQDYPQPIPQPQPEPGPIYAMYSGPDAFN